MPDYSTEYDEYLVKRNSILLDRIDEGLTIEDLLPVYQQITFQVEYSAPPAVLLEYNLIQTAH